MSPGSEDGGGGQGAGQAHEQPHGRHPGKGKDKGKKGSQKGGKKGSESKSSGKGEVSQPVKWRQRKPSRWEFERGEAFGEQGGGDGCHSLVAEVAGLLKSLKIWR